MHTKLMWTVALSAAIIGIAAIGNALATPASGFVGTTIASGRLDQFDVLNYALLDDPDGKPRRNPRKHLWVSSQKTKGASDVYVQNNTWAPGGTTGWHTHPGHSIITVTKGQVTVYEAHEHSCTPTVYAEGETFVDAGGEHVHVIRNETSAEAGTITFQVIPAGAARRVDAEAPAGCAIQ